MRKQFLDLIYPSLIMIISIICVILQPVLFNKINILIIFQLFGCALLTFIIPIISKYIKLTLPWQLNFLICTHILLSMCLGNSLRFYSLIPWWDLLVHGMFGAICTYGLMTFFHNDKITMMLLYNLSTIGLGAIWEVFEYCADLLLGGDTQRIEESLQNGKLPQADTLEDIIITIVGSIIFSLFYFLIKYITNNIKKKRLTNK